MSSQFGFLLQSVAWPVVLLLAWFLGERVHEAWRLPRVCTYVAVGLAGGLFNLPGLTPDVPGLSFLANMALSLVLFELGYRMHLGWFRHNPWVLVHGVLESLLTLAAVYWASSVIGLSVENRLIVAALAVSASPAGIVRVANELRSAGQVTERVLHLCAINCLVAVLALKLVVGYWTLNTSGDLLQAILGSVHVLVTSVAIGALLGVVMPALLRASHTTEGGVAVVFALAVVLLTALSYGLKFSPLLAALAFGVVARERRVHLTNAQRNFGTAGDAASLFLFVYIASLLDWSAVVASLLAGVLLTVVRLVTRVGVSVGLAWVSGITLRKGVLTGLALTPLSVYAILLMEQTRQMGFEPAAEITAAMTAMMLLHELLGPLATQRALRAAGETP